MRWEPNPLYEKRTSTSFQWPRWALVAVMLAAVAFTVWLVLDGHYVIAAIYAVASLVNGVYIARRHWPR